MTSGERLVAFLHGLGERADAWTHQVSLLPEGMVGVVPPIRGLDDDEDFTVAGAAEAVLADLDRRGIRSARLCGLSLGAVIATRIAIDHPERVDSLLLSGGQVRPPRALMAAQSALLRVLPEVLAAPPGVERARVLAVLEEVGRLDLRADLARITAPTTVVCGSRDLANLPAARALARGIPGARLHVVSGAGHHVHRDAPEEFAALVAGSAERPAPGGRSS